MGSPRLGGMDISSRSSAIRSLLPVLSSSWELGLLVPELFFDDFFFGSLLFFSFFFFFFSAGVASRIRSSMSGMSMFSATTVPASRDTTRMSTSHHQQVCVAFFPRVHPAPVSLSHTIYLSAWSATRLPTTACSLHDFRCSCRSGS